LLSKKTLILFLKKCLNIRNKVFRKIVFFICRNQRNKTKKMNTSINTYSIEQLQGMMADLINSQKETDLKFKETDLKFKETDKKFKEVLGELGGIGNNNGAIAEDFFGTALANTMKVGDLEFESIDFNLRRKHKNTMAEYDIILYNKTKVIVIEVKYHLQKEHLRKFYEGGLKKFRTLFPLYNKYKLYGGVAALSFEQDAKEEAEKYGFYVLTQNNKQFHIANSEDFQPKEIK